MDMDISQKEKMEVDPAGTERSQDEREEIQKKSFSIWINNHLDRSQEQKRITDLFYDLRDGHILLSLLEVLTEAPVSRETGSLRVHHLANTAAVLGILQRQRVRITDINNMDLVDGNPKMTLALVWAIILHWQFHKVLTGLSPSLAHTNQEKILLAWVRQSILSSPLLDPPSVTNFTSDWTDGHAFCGVLLAHRPGLVAAEAVMEKEPLARMEMMFRLAESHIDIPQMLDPQDLSSGLVDKKCVITYVMCLFQCLPHDKLTEENVLDVSLSSDPGFSVMTTHGSPAKTPVKALVRGCKLKEEKKDIPLVPMDVKDIKKMEIMSNKRKLKVEDEKTKKINVELYCVLCQTYGHILSEECVARAICFDCGVKGHTRRDCKEDRCHLKNEIKFEKVKDESSNSENEYVEEEIPKDEPNNDMKLQSDSDTIEIRKDRIDSLNMSQEYIEEDIDDKKNIKVEVYCILCQMYGHIYSEACVVNAVCFVCGVKGHVSRDCKEVKCELKHLKLEIKNERIKYEEEYVEVDINKSEPKTEMNLECNSEEAISSSSTSTSKENEERFSRNRKDGQNEVILKDDIDLTDVEKNCGQTHSLKNCTVDLFKMNIYYKVFDNGEKPFQCSLCSKWFSRKDFLNQHKRSHTGEKPDNLDNLNTHKKMHTGEKPFQCLQCPKTFSHSSTFNSHMRIHTGEKPYQCLQCPKRFSLISNLNMHKKVHTGEKPYQCFQCPKRFSQKSHLITHNKIHTGEKPFQCLQCLKTFSQISSLNSHKMIHTGEKPYQCLQCPKRFSLISILNAHKKIHTSEKPYQCLQCSKTFSESSRLNAHKKIHLVEKKYQCSQCFKKFREMDSLKKHRTTHTGEKPFQCLVCSKWFSRRENLYRHKKIHTNQ